LGLEYPNLAFQTFNNIAHSYNIQGNVTASIENLVYSLEYGHAIKDIEELNVFSND
jgi:hypothetical protein